MPDGTVLYDIVQQEYEEGNTKISETYVDGVLTTRVSPTYLPLEN